MMMMMIARVPSNLRPTTLTFYLYLFHTHALKWVGDFSTPISRDLRAKLGGLLVVSSPLDS